MSYHTCLKETARNGTLPEKYRKTIPRSTQWRWKNENPDKYIGSELCEDKYDLQTLLQLIEKYPALFFAYGRLVKVVLDIVAATQNFPALVRAHKDTVVHTVLHVKDTLGLKKALKIFRLSRSTFDRWLLQLKAECIHNYLNLCIRRMPQQLTRDETDMMRKLLADPNFSHWGITSLAYYAMRKNLVMASPATWYKYNQLLGIRKRRCKREKPPYSGLRANQPNEYWHADITYFRTLDQQLYYIYLVMDNFSRFILDYYVADRIDGVLRMESLRRAYAYALTITPDLDVNLIVDGGPENVNHSVDHFLQQSGMTRRIALRDISFSNWAALRSMIEAANKSLKYRHLFPKQIENLAQLQKVLKATIDEYNHVKPHASLHGYTPAELYHGMVLQTSRFSGLLQQAREQRIAYHQSQACRHC